jgi:DNA-binding MarR family transcriptional regulator
MSRAVQRPVRPPLIAVVHRTSRALQTDMVDEAHRAGHPEIKQAHNAVFATLHGEGQRAVDMAARMGITRQSMGEIVREMVGLGILEMVADPADGRAKLVRYSEAGLATADQGFRHIAHLEERFVQEFGREDYETTRRVLGRVADMLEADSAAESTGESAEPPPRAARGS